MAGELGSLVLALSADVAGFRSDMEKASAVAGQHAQAMNKVFGGVQTAIAGITAGAMVAYFKGLVDLAEQTNKLSQRTGHAVEFLSELRIAAEQSDVSFEDLGGSLGKFNMSLVEARDAGSKTGQIMKVLGVDITKGPTEAFKQFAERASAIEDAATKTAVFREVLGKTGDSLIPLMANLDAATASARKMGGTMSAETAANAEKLNDALSILSSTAKAMTINAITPAVGALAEMVDNIAKAAEKGEKWIQVLREAGKLTVALTAGTLRMLPGEQEFDKVGEWAFNRMSPTSRGLPGWGDLKKPAQKLTPNAAALNAALTPEEQKKRAEAIRKAAEEAKKHTDELLKKGVLSEEKAAEARFDIAQQAYIDQGQLDKNALEERNRLYAEADKANFESWASYMEEQESTLNAVATARAQAIHAENSARDKDMDEQRKRQTAALEAESKKGAEAARQLGLTFTSAFEDMIIKGNSFRDVLGAIAQDLMRMAARKFVTEPLAAGFNSLFSGGGSVPGFTDAQMADGTLAGFAGGGSFMVGGSGGTDSQTVAFKASPNERVDILTPGQQGRSGGGLVINQSISVGGNVTQADLLATMRAAKQGAIDGVAALAKRDRGYRAALQGA